jgi:hypothetical protein
LEGVDAAAPRLLLVIRRGFDDVVSGRASLMTLERTSWPTRVTD